MKTQLPLLLIGDTSAPEALGSKLIRGAQVAGLNPREDILVAYNSPAARYSPSMQHLGGRIFYRIADRRSWEWWPFQDYLKDVISSRRPGLILVTGILPLTQEVFHHAKESGGHIVSYLTDDPWNPIHRRRSYLKNIRLYDHIFSTKQLLEARLRAAGAKSTSWLPFAYDPEIHHAPKTMPNKSVDIVFVGTGDKERLKWLDVLSDLKGVTRRIHGNNWGGIPVPGWEKQPAVVGEDYCLAISSATVVLGLLREGNGDQSTDRSYEIGAIGGCGLYQDTPEHRKLLRSYPDAGFFSTPKQLRERVEALLVDPGLQKHLRSMGEAAIKSGRETYGERLKTIMKWNYQKQ